MNVSAGGAKGAASADSSDQVPFMSQRTPLFRFSPALSDVAHVARHSSVIEAVHYIPCLDSLLVIERKSGLIKLYDACTYEVTDEIMLPRGSPTSAHYIASLKSVVFCFGDTIMGVWDFNRDSPTFKQMKCGPDGRTPICWPAAEVQLSLLWIEKHQLLYSGSRDGVVQAWNVRERREEKIDDRPMIGHSDMIMDLHYLDSLDTMASASLDSNICIWDLYTGRREHVLRGHRLGVSSLTYCADRRLLVSAGFDHEALVWSPFGSSQIFSLKGHMTSLVGVDMIGDPRTSNQIITSDSDGIQKIWDMRKFQCLQTIDNSFKNTTASAYVPAVKTGSRKRTAGCVTATKDLHVYRQDAASGQGVLSLTDDRAINFVRVCGDKILTITDRSVKVWNLRRGTLLREFRDLVSSDISAACIVNDGIPPSQGGMRELVLGMHDGTMASFSVATGVQTKTYFAHTSEIVSLVYHPIGGGSSGGEPSRALQTDHGLLLSADWHGVVILHDVGTLDGGTEAVVRSMDPSRMQGHTDDIIALALFAPEPRPVGDHHRRDKGRSEPSSPRSSDETSVTGNVVAPMVVATGAADQTIKLWHARDGKLADVITLPKGHVTCMVFLDPYPLLAAAASDGHIYVFGTTGGKYAGQQLFSFMNVVRKGVPVVVISLQWNKRSQVLFSGNEDADMYALDFRALLATLDFDEATYGHAAEQANRAAEEAKAEEKAATAKRIAEAQAAAAAAAAMQQEEAEALESHPAAQGSAMTSPRSPGAGWAGPTDGDTPTRASDVLKQDSAGVSERPLSPEIELQVGTDDTSLQPALHRVGGTDDGQVGTGGLLVFTGSASMAEPVVLWHEPQAHNDVITSLLLVPEMKVVLSASADCHVKMWSTRRGPASNGMFLGSLRQGGQVDWAPPGTTAQRNEKNSSHGGTSSDQGTALEAKLGDDEEVDVPTHPRLQEWDHRAAPELGDLKTQLFIPKKRSSSQRGTSTGEASKSVLLKHKVTLMPTSVPTVRHGKLPSVSKLMSASERFVQQQEEYMRISKEHKAARGSIVNFDETHELIKAMRNTFTSRRTMHDMTIEDINHAFMKNDPSKRGTISRGDFMLTLDQLKCLLPDAMAKELADMLTNNVGQIAYRRFLEVCNLPRDQHAAADAHDEERKKKFERNAAIKVLKDEMTKAFLASDVKELERIVAEAKGIGAHAQARIAHKLLNQVLYAND